MSHPIAILASDLHLSHTKPKSREGDWYATMRTHLRELRSCLSEYSTGDRPLPLIVAGDIFDTWSVPPELISFAIRELPPCWAVPGQHDLPNHSYQDIGRSAYWSLVEAGVIKNLPPGELRQISQWVKAVGVPWGFEIPNLPDVGRRGTGLVHLAVVHAYIWDRKRNSYEGAPQDKSIGQYVGQLQDYDAAVFGDNHKGFLVKPKEDDDWGRLQSLLNCGGFMRRKSDDVWDPKIGLLYSGGDIKRITLESPESDKLQASPASDKKDGGVDMGFLNEVATQVGLSENFLEAVKHAADDVQLKEATRSAVRKIWENAIGRRK